MVKSKATLYLVTGYKIHDEEVKRVHESTASTIIASAPARTSKSYTFGHGEIVHSFFPKLDADKMLPLIPRGNDANRSWIVGTDYTTTKEWDYAWSDLIDNGLIEAFAGRIESAANSPNQGNMKIVANFGRTPDGRICRSILQAKSASNERSLQGEAVVDGLLSEAADHDERVVKKYLMTRCERLLFPTTPKIAATWLYEMIKAGEENPDLRIDSFRFSPRCNPAYDWERFRKAQLMAESRQGKGRAAEDPEFAEQFLGMWVFEGGKILPFRWMDLEDGRPSHVVDEPPLGIEMAEWFVSTDYGYDHPAVALWWAKLPDGQIHIDRELYERGLNTSAFIDQIRDVTNSMGIRPAYYVGDPRRPEVADLMVQNGLPIYPRDARLMKERAGSHAALVELMSHDPVTNQCRFSISNSCQRTINEWKHLRRKDGWTGDEYAAAALQGRDDSYDAARYGASTVIRELPDKRANSMTQRHRRARLRARRQPNTSGPLLVGPSPGMAA
jgi:hypothetical protein